MRIGVLGLGLVGGSIAKKIQAQENYQVFGFDALSGTCSLAKSEGIEILSPEEMSEACDLVVVATDVSATAEEVEKLLLFGAPAVIDVASIKGPILRDLKHLPGDLLGHYLATHPMAGSQKQGFVFAKSDLLDHCTWAVSGSPSLETFLSFARMATLFDASLIPIDARKHDMAVAKSSHLIQLLHTTIAADLSDDDNLTLLLSGPALRDTTRLAESYFEGFWEDVFRENGEFIQKAKKSLLKELEKDDNLKDLWRHASLGRDRLLSLRWEEKKWRQFSVPLATWWTDLLLLGEEGIRIKNPQKEDYLLLFQRSF